MLVFLFGGLLLLAGATESFAMIGPVGSSWCAACGATLMATVILARACRRQRSQQKSADDEQMVAA